MTCPFCGLSCDDLQVRAHDAKPSIVTGGCALARERLREALEHDPTSVGPRIQGSPAVVEDAIAHAAQLLADARLPVIDGLATDVAGVRAALRLADDCGATVGHANGAAMARNVRVLQDTGWIATTLTEARNRADCMVLAGTGVLRRFPRLLERILQPRQTIVPEAGRRRSLVLLGPCDADLVRELADLDPLIVDVPPAQLSDVIGTLRALLRGAPLHIESVAGIGLESLAQVVTRMRDARYGVIAWAAAELDFAHGELTVESIAGLVRELNRTTRFAGMPMAGSEGDVTANQVSTWQSGYPLPVSFGPGHPEHDPARHDPQALVATGEADALLWLSTFSPALLPPPSDVPTVLVGHPGMTPVETPEVFLPAGVPGVDHGGHIYRSDGVVTLPLHRQRHSDLRPAASLLEGIRARLRAGASEPGGNG